MKTVTSTTGSLLKREGDFSQPVFILSRLPAEGLSTAWLCFVSATIYHGFCAAWSVTGKSPVATVCNKVILSHDWLSQHCEEGAAVLTCHGGRMWHYFCGKNRYSSRPPMLWVAMYQVLCADPSPAYQSRSPWADGCNGIFLEHLPAFIWRPLKVWRWRQHFHSKSNFLHLTVGQIDIQSVPRCFN